MPHSQTAHDAHTESKHDLVSVICKMFFLFLTIVATVYGCNGTPAYGGELVQVTSKPATAITLDSGLVPAQNPWNVRIGIDSVVLVPAHESRNISKALMERNACIEISKAQGTIIQNQKALRSLDSVSIANLKQQGTLKDSLVVLERSKSASSKWSWFAGGAGVGTFVGGAIVTVIVILTSSH